MFLGEKHCPWKPCHISHIDCLHDGADSQGFWSEFQAEPEAVKQGGECEEHDASEHLRSDNGPEFIAQAVQQWLRYNPIKTIYIDPGSPWRNGFVESFHGRFRDECLNREQLWTLTEARVVIENYRYEYNQRRSHSRLGYQSPARFAAQLTPSSSAVGRRPPSVGDGQTQNPSSK